MLIIYHKKECDDLQIQVYRETLDYIVKNAPKVTVYQFIDDKGLLEFINGRDFSSVIATMEISYQTSLLLKGLGLIQIIIGVKKELENIADIIIDPNSYKSGKYFVGHQYLLHSILKKYSAESLSKLMQVGPDILEREVSHNDAENKLLDIVQLFQKLEWDSKFFGINIGYVSCLRLTPNIEKHIKKYIRKEKIDLLEYLCNCHDKESVSTAEKNGYSFVDIRITFEKVLKDKIDVEERENYYVRKGERNDIKKLKEIAKNIYKYSRYYYDPNFNRDKVVEFYSNWVEKAILGQFDDYGYVLYHCEQPIGFCTIKEQPLNTAKIGLIGLHADYLGNGLGKYLLDMTLKKLRDNGINYVEVVTQGRNYTAQRLYQKCGFITKMTELWYHKWFH